MEDPTVRVPKRRRSQDRRGIPPMTPATTAGRSRLSVKRSGGRAFVLLVVSGQLVTLVAIPLLTRLCSPVEFGHWQQWLSACLLLSAVAHLRMDLHVQRATDADRARRHLGFGARATLWLSPGSAVLVGALMWAVADQPVGLAVVFGVVGGATTCAIALTQLVSSYALYLGRHRASGLLQAWSNSLTTLTQLAGAALIPTALVLCVATLLGRTAALIPRAKLLFRSFRQGRTSPISFSDLGFGVASTVATQIALWAPLLLLPMAMSAHSFGYFALAWRVVTVPMSLIGGALAQLWVARVGQRVRASVPLMPDLRRWISLAGALVLVVFAPAAILASSGAQLLFGGQWEGAGRFIVALLPILAGQLLVAPLGQTFVVAGRARTQLAVDSTRAVIVVAVCAGLALARPPAGVAVALVGGAIGFAYLLQLSYTLFFVSQLTRSFRPTRSEV